MIFPARELNSTRWLWLPKSSRQVGYCDSGVLATGFKVLERAAME
jgi:hypothetical protein